MMVYPTQFAPLMAIGYDGTKHTQRTTFSAPVPVWRGGCRRRIPVPSRQRVVVLQGMYLYYVASIRSGPGTANE